MLDSHLADDLAEPSWYVMPVAKTIREALSDDPDPEAAVAAVADIAATLAALALEGVGIGTSSPTICSNWRAGG